MKTALVYLRVSTNRQAEKGLSIPSQKVHCLQYAKDQGYEVNEQTDIYIDLGESARTSNRPNFQVLWERCRKDISVKAVIFYDISRLARNRIDFALIKDDLAKRGIMICSATEGTDSSSSGQLLEGVLSTVAEFFSVQNGEKVKLGMAQKVKDGWWANKAPYGYQNVQERLTTGKVRAWLEVNWEEAKWVIRAFELFATGNYSTKSLAKQLQKEGMPVRKHKRNKNKIHASLIERILRSKFYIGLIQWGNMKNPDGKHELFLDKQLFEKVQAILDARLGGGSRIRRLFSVIKSVSFCAECGSRQTVEEKITSSGNKIQYLRCLKSKNSERVPCSQKYAHEEVILEQLEGLIKMIKLPEGFVIKLRARIQTLFSEEQNIYEKARQDILGKIEDIKRQKKNLTLQLIDKDKNSISDLELYQSIKAELDIKGQQLEEDLVKSENRIVSAVKTVEVALSLAADCHYTYQKAAPELRALFVRTFFKQILIKDKQIVQATLNEPLDYLCANRLQKYPVFGLATYSGPDRD